MAKASGGTKGFVCFDDVLHSTAHIIASIETRPSKAEIRDAQKSLKEWGEETFIAEPYGKSEMKRLHIEIDNEDVIINKTVIKETTSKHKEDPLYCLKLEYVKRIPEMASDFRFARNETQRDHPDSTFAVYEADDDGYKVELKIKRNRDGNIAHVLRLYKK